MTDISQKQGGWTPKEFADRIAASDVTVDDVNRLQIAALYGRILKKEERREISQTLGVLKAILHDARANPSTDQGGES